MKYLITVIFLLISTVSIAQDKIDIIIVKKSERILYAVKDDKIIKEPNQDHKNHFFNLKNLNIFNLNNIR